MSNLNTLRQHMFETLDALKNGTIDIEKAKVMGEIGQVLINTAKVEVDYLRANNGGQSNFLTSNANGLTETKTGLKIVEGNVTTHKLR